jgi:hypothetical protein
VIISYYTVAAMSLFALLSTDTIENMLLTILKYLEIISQPYSKRDRVKCESSCCCIAVKKGAFF